MRGATERWRAPARSLTAMVLVGIGCSGARPSSGPPPTPEGATDAAASVIDATPSTTSIRLPADESPHSDPIEWWYYTGLLVGSSPVLGGAELETTPQQRFGFELVVFQAMIGKRPVYMAHFAVTDVARGEFYPVVKSGLRDQHRDGEGFDLHVGPFRMQGHEGRDRLIAATEEYGIDLTLAAEKPVVFQYGDGEMTIGSTEPFYYYSYTRMAAAGTLTVNGVAATVTGAAWMDHQWGEMGREFSGWDWLSLRLDDNTEVMIFQVRRAESFVGGTFIAADGKFRELESSDISFTATGKWTSPHTRATYPHGWAVRVDSLGLDVTLTPVMADQEFYHSVFNSPVYWEGLCEVAGKRGGDEITGHAYVELVGYQ